MHSKKIEQLKNGIKLTKEQREIIVGLILGDGCVETQNNGRTYRLKVEQSIQHKDYVDWLYGKLKELTLTRPKMGEKNGYKKATRTYGFQTLSLGNLRFYGQEFYSKDRKKQIPKIIKKLLSPLAIAVWFMDDGSIKSRQHRALLISTHCFSKGDLMRLIKALKEKFDIETRLKKEETGYRLYILSKSIPNFLKIVSPFIHSSMKYKLGININA